MRRGLLVLGGALLLTTSASAQVPALPGDAGYDATSWVNAHGRGLDQSRNPDYQQRMIPGYQAGATSAPGWERLFFTDPYLAEDGPRRADWRDVTFPNRYGAAMSATIIAPKDAGRHPAIVIEPGGYGPRWTLLNLAQGLAEAGYVTMTIAPQGDADAAVAPADPDPSTSDNEYCRPYDFGGWQQGEGGVTEDGPCAGQETPAPPLGPPTDVVATSVADGLPPGLDEAYRAVRARKAFGVLDATRFLVSDDNPWRDRVDASHIGVAGHSFGAHGALVAGQIDSRRLIDAVVAWDGFGPLDGIEPRVPTMFQHSEARLIGPHRPGRDPNELPQAAIEAAFRHNEVDTMLVTLANATHQEWNYLPYLGVTVGSLALNGDPTAAEGAAASSLGERVALHYTLAWFDRWLKPARKKSARRRLLARRFDRSADRVAIGQGTYDARTQRNVPYTIAGDRVHDRLSAMFTSRADFDGIACPDLRAGCAP
jgi:dienelactone hydrolase